MASRVRQISPLEPLITVLLERLNRRHRLQLLLHAWKAAAQEPYASDDRNDYLLKLTMYRVERWMGLVGVDDELYNDRETHEVICREMAVQLTRLACADFFAVARKYPAPPNTLYGRSIPRALRIAASSFVTGEPVDSDFTGPDYAACVPP